MKDYLVIGSSPCEEDCAQVSTPDYYEKSRRELKAFIHQLRRAFGEEPIGAILKIKSFPHDFGTYSEVVCEYADDNETATDYAYNCENKMPSNWDEEAKIELGIKD